MLAKCLRLWRYPDSFYIPETFADMEDCPRPEETSGLTGRPKKLPAITEISRFKSEKFLSILLSF